VKIECRGFFSYEVLKNPLRIGFSPRKPVFEPFVVVEIFIWKFFAWIYKLSSRKCKTKWSRAVRNGHITYRVKRSGNPSKILARKNEATRKIQS